MKKRKTDEMDISVATTTMQVAGNHGSIEILPKRTTIATDWPDCFSLTIKTDDISARIYECMDDEPMHMPSHDWLGYYDAPMTEWVANIRYQDGRSAAPILDMIPNEKKRRSRAFRRVGDDNIEYICVFCTSLSEAFSIVEGAVREAAKE